MVYIPPDGTDADFELLSYTPPSGTEADFDFTGFQQSDILSEVVSAEAVDSEILSETESDGWGSTILSELQGYGNEASEILSEVLGTADIPVSLGYRILVKDETGALLGEVDTFRSVTFGKRLNNYGEASFDMKVRDPKASTFIDLRKNTIEIYREKEFENNLVWAGEQAMARGELNDAGNNWATIHSFTWFEKLFHRYTPQEVIYGTEGAEIDQGEIAEDMIETTNADDPTGITIGTIVPTTDRIRQYHSQNIAEGIINLANVIDGFDFEVTDLKAFNVDSIIGVDRTNEVVFRYGHNVKTARIVQDFTNPINRAIVLGEAVEEDTLQRVERNDAGLQTTYGLREGRLQELDVSGMSTLEDKGDAAIRKYGMPLLKVEFGLVRGVSPSIDSFTVGDGIRLIIQDGFYNIDEQYRVFEWEVTFDSAGAETLQLTLGNFITI